jgi:hypothetical protein
LLDLTPPKPIDNSVNVFIWNGNATEPASHATSWLDITRVVARVLPFIDSESRVREYVVTLLTRLSSGSFVPFGFTAIRSINGTAILGSNPREVGVVVMESLGAPLTCGTVYKWQLQVWNSAGCATPVFYSDEFVAYTAAPTAGTVTVVAVSEDSSAGAILQTPNCVSDRQPAALLLSGFQLPCSAPSLNTSLLRFEVGVAAAAESEVDVVGAVTWRVVAVSMGQTMITVPIDAEQAVADAGNRHVVVFLVRVSVINRFVLDCVCLYSVRHRSRLLSAILMAAAGASVHH